MDRRKIEESPDSQYSRLEIYIQDYSSHLGMWVVLSLIHNSSLWNPYNKNNWFTNTSKTLPPRSCHLYIFICFPFSTTCNISQLALMPSLLPLNAVLVNPYWCLPFCLSQTQPLNSQLTNSVKAISASVFSKNSLIVKLPTEFWKEGKISVKMLSKPWMYETNYVSE